MRRIALLSAPWPLFNRPSIQLGALKAFLQEALPETKVVAYHVYLVIAEALGYDLYKQISERAWLSETLSAALLNPRWKGKAEHLWKKQSRRSLQEQSFQRLCRTLKTLSDRFVSSVNWQEYALAGFSICYAQMTSSLYLIHRIKEKAPWVKIVAGGSACSGEMGQSLLNTFRDIDFVISGEGEIPFAHLVRWLSRPGHDQRPDPVPGLLHHERDSDRPIQDSSQVPDLDVLPIPDFDDYFGQLKSIGPQKQFLPELPMEMSRGCWWQKISPGRRHTGCAFCNLNLQWKGYRSKSRERIFLELKTLTEKHQVLSVCFMDNLLPVKDSKALFCEMARIRKDFRLFAEI